MGSAYSKFHTKSCRLGVAHAPPLGKNSSWSSIARAFGLRRVSGSVVMNSSTCFKLVRKALSTVLVSGAMLAFVAVPSAVHAGDGPDGFPKRQITIIVCFGAGGGSDQMARAMAAAAKKVLGVPVVVTNKKGAGGLGCMPDFLGAPADGYTILQHTDNLVTLYASKKSELNPATDVKPLLIANVVASQIFINPKDKRFVTGGKPDFDKVLSYAKANPGKLTVANYGTTENLEGVTMGKLEKFFGIKTKIVAFDKPAERYGSVVGGRIDVLFEQISDVRSLVESGDLAPVLSIWPKRFKVYPDTKATGQDYGMKWTPTVKWRALFVRKDTPKPIFDFLEGAMKKAWAMESHQAWLKKKGMHLLNSYRSSAEATEIARGEIETYSAAYRELGLPSR